MNRKSVLLSAAALCLLLLAGCGGAKNQPAQNVQLANPWKDYATLQEAEEAVGFSMELLQAIADPYQPQAFRVMNGTLLEVICCSEEDEVTLRKAVGEEDISGDYNQYETLVTEERADGSVLYRKNGDTIQGMLLFRDEYVWSVLSETGLEAETAEKIVSTVFGG